MVIQRRDKGNVKALSYMLFEAYGITVKFKVKMSMPDKNNIEKSVAQEYFLANSTSIMINSSSFIEVTLRTKEFNEYFVINELYRARLIRTLQKITNALELYDSQEIDILMNTNGVTRIRSELVQPISIAIGNQNVTFTPGFDSERGFVIVNISYGAGSVNMKVSQYLTLIQKLKEIDFDGLTMSMINYYNTYNEKTISQVDMNGPMFTDHPIDMIPTKTLTPPSNDLDSLTEEKPSTKKYTKLNW